MTNQKKVIHADGPIYPEGTPALSRRFMTCRDIFEMHTRSCYDDIRYEWWPKEKAWFMIISPAAGGGIQIL
jgi:hypothetical protein